MTWYYTKHRPSDETLNQDPDSLWSLKIPGCPSKKSRGVWPSWPPNHPHTLIGFITLSPLHQWAGVWWAFWRTMAAVASSRWMLHIGGGWGDSRLLCKALWVPRKSAIQMELIIIIIIIFTSTPGSKWSWCIHQLESPTCTAVSKWNRICQRVVS